MATVETTDLIKAVHGRLSKRSKECLQTVKSSGTMYLTMRELHNDAAPSEKQLECRSAFGGQSSKVGAWMKTHHDDPLYKQLKKEHNDKRVKAPLLNYIMSLEKEGKIVLSE